MNILDVLVITFYLGTIVWIAKWASKPKGDGSFSSADYFLAGKNQGWLVIGASLFASNIGSEIILGVSGAGARGDMPTANFEILAALILILFGWVFVPFYLRSGVYTMPEFLEKRYSPACRTYLSVVSILAYIITKISLIIFSGALIFQVMGVPFWTGAVMIVVATGIYTVLGGLKAVVYTDLLQAFVLILGMFAITAYGLYYIGGWDELITILGNAAQQGAGPEPKEFFNLWRPSDDTNYPWTGIIFGAPILGIWYWCTDQYIVQRALSAKDEQSARRGALFAGYLKLLPVFVFFIPGVIAYALMQEGLLDYSLSNPDQALPALITSFLPSGLKGLAIAGLLAALMSSLASSFNSSSTLITIDFYRKRKPDASEAQLVRFGRIVTVILVFVSLGWIPLMKTLMGGGIFHYLQSIQAYISPPIAAVFLFGLCFKWINARGAIVALWAGFAIGMSRLVLEFMSKEGVLSVVDGGLISGFLAINFLHFALLLFLICAALLMLVSRMTEPQPLESLRLITFQKSDNNFVWTTDHSISMLLVGCVLALWWFLSSWGVGSMLA